MSNLPVDFEEKIRAASSPTGAGYPVQISASDLMRNFVFAAGAFDEDQFDVTETTSDNSQYTTQKISLKSPLEGTNQGEMPWWNIEANENAGGWQMLQPSNQGTFFYWNKSLNNFYGGWQQVPNPTRAGFFAWDEDLNESQGGWSLVAPSENGQMLYYSADAKKWQTITPAENSIFYFQNREWKTLTAPTSGTHVLGAVDGTLQWIATEQC